jgi:methanogenic corrinoid protein MtbC1/DNA-binding XRE family transcriptional regulator
MCAEAADFATRLRELRKRRGLRQVDLAQAFGIAQTTIANYEKKLRFPDERMLGRFADFFEEPSESEDAGRATPISDTTARYLALLRTSGIEVALDFIQSAIRGGMSVKQVYLGILEPALGETGRLWERGELRVGEEHAISEATQRIMSRIVPVSPPVGAESRRPTCLALAISRDQHTIGSRMVADFLRLDGWDVSFPRGNLGIRHVIEMLEARPPDLLAVSVTIAENVSEAEYLFSVVRERRSLRGVRILAGGKAFQRRPSLWQEIGADGTGKDAESAVKTADGLVER